MFTAVYVSIADGHNFGRVCDNIDHLMMKVWDHYVNEVWQVNSCLCGCELYIILYLFSTSRSHNIIMPARWSKDEMNSYMGSKYLIINQLEQIT